MSLAHTATAANLLVAQSDDVGAAGGFLCAFLGVGSIVGFVFLRRYYVAAKREMLLTKYRDPEVVEKIMRKTFWIGATAEQTRDAIGLPVAIDRKVLKTKTTETWKYLKAGKNRYDLRIKLDNGIVVGWEDKR